MDPKDPQTSAQTTGADPTPAPADPTPSANPSEPATPDPGTGDEPTQPPAAPADPQQPDAGAQTPDGQQPARGGGQPRGERRIKQLSDKIKQSAQQPNQPMGGSQPSPQMPSYEDGQVVPPEQLQRDVVQTADAIADIRVTQRLAQHDAVNNFSRDQETVPATYDELNPDNPSFTPELDESIAAEFQDRAFRVVGHDAQGNPITQLDPSVRLSDIAARQVKAARAYAAKTSADMKNSVATTADEAAPRPGGAPPAERKFEDLSIPEMEAKLGMMKR